MFSLILNCFILLMILKSVLNKNLTEEIDVLVFLPKNNSFLFSQARVAPAIRYAQNALKTDFPNFHFTLNFADSDSVNQAVFTFADRSCDHKPDLILGPVREYEAAGVVRLASHWNIPVISAGALAVAFRNKDTEYSHLTRIAPSYMKMAEIFTAMFEHFTWRSALLLIEDDMKERDCYFTLEAVFHVMEDYTVRSLTFSQEEPLRGDEMLRNIHDVEVVIMCAGADRIREIMLVAHDQQLTNGSYMFFNVDLFNASSYGNGSWRRGDEYDDNARQAYASLNTVTLLRTVKPEYRNFSIEIKTSTDRLGLHDCSDCGNVCMSVCLHVCLNCCLQQFRQKHLDHHGTSSETLSLPPAGDMWPRSTCLLRDSMMPCCCIQLHYMRLLRTDTTRRMEERSPHTCGTRHLKELLARYPWIPMVTETGTFH
ncbi:atrial natriuretic peptide receptor 3 isoform X2 [Austrofundulus limnaeus]|uniref:Atrial natriuretic peptide receptor 3 isoform X2 n=1 Tax=Austrofundulus limnaeus TaxID=52670 RepID=A0A2I4CT35_AUSLI|nr:PREDICTED: atrial natriuretic peptide receptor 3 isoform X2 [Austrofundulus limnaeus]